MNAMVYHAQKEIVFQIYEKSRVLILAVEAMIVIIFFVNYFTKFSENLHCNYNIHEDKTGS